MTYLLSRMKTYDLIKGILEDELDTRNSDKLLCWKVWQEQGLIGDGYLSYDGFIKGVHFETIRRTRQKIQELYPSLKGTRVVQKARKKIAKQKGTHIFRETTMFDITDFNKRCD